VAAIACVVGALASPAFASKEKPKAFFGEFFANVPTGGPITPSTPVTAKTSEGELGALYLGSEEKGPFSFSCSSLSSSAKVTAEKSENFLTEIKFHKCKAIRRLRGGLEETIGAKFQKGFEMEFHSNGSASVGKSEGETKIVKGTQAEIKVRGGVCKIIIPEQTIPTKAEKAPEKEFESAEYGTFEEKTEKLKVFPNGLHDTLEIAWELNKITFYIPSAPTGPCSYNKEPGGKFNPEKKVVEFPGYFEGELEEIEVKKGNIGFEPA
jgi:hypothetical protein